MQNKRLFLFSLFLFFIPQSFAQQKPDILYYNFDTTGTVVRNLATNPPSGTQYATLMGSMSIDTGGRCGTNALKGTGGSSTNDYVNTGWSPAISGSWTISFRTKYFGSTSSLFYIFGDINTSSFRCFTNGVAGTNNWILRGGGITDSYIFGGAIADETLNTFVYNADSNKIYTYLNGTLQGTYSQGTPNLNGSGPFKVGAYSSTNGLASGSLMDEFRFYNRALTQLDIDSLFTLCPNNSSLAFSLQPYDTNVCEGSSTLFSIISSGQDSIIWQNFNGSSWLDISNSNNDTLFLNTVTYSMNGYAYRCKIFAGSNMLSSDSVNLTVFQAPSITGITSSLNPSFNSPYQPLKCSNLTATTTGGTGSYTYTWSPSGSGNPLNVCPTIGTWYTAMVTDSFGCQDTMSVKQYVIDASYPDPTRVVMCVNVGRRWSSNPVWLSSVPYYLSKGYTLGKCGALPSKQNGFDIDESDADYVVYPNPFNSELNVEFIQYFEENVNIQLTDLTGRVVKEIFNGKLYEDELVRFTVNASDLPSGMYLVRYSSNSDLRVNKVQLVR